MRHLPALAALLLLALRAAAAPPAVALDVGHSHARPGATSARGVAEFDFNLKLAQAIAAELEKAGVAVRLIGADGLADDLRACAPARRRRPARSCCCPSTTIPSSRTTSAAGSTTA